MSNPRYRYPRFRRSHLSSELVLTDSEEGRQAGKIRPAWSPPLSKEDVDRQARNVVSGRGGDLSDPKDILGEYILQSGKYRGKSFRWLLENVPGYVGWFVNQIIKDEGKDDPSGKHQKDSKSAFKKYVEMFEEGRKLIQMKQNELKTPAQSQTSSIFSTLLKGRDLPPQLLRHKVKSLTSPSKFKPAIPAQPELREEGRSSLALEEIFSDRITEEDQQLAEVLEQAESTEVVSLPGPSSELLLYQGWKATLPKVDQQWISKAFFRRNPVNNKIEFRSEQFKQLWHSPPPPSFSPSVRNKADRYFAHRMFLWMPVNMWGVRLLCPYTDESGECKGILTRSGIHQKTRLVLDLNSYYIAAAEYLRCSTCGRKVISWAHNILQQLDNDRQMLFPCILTAKLACDKKVVALLRNRGLGNSSSMVCKQLEEEHGDNYLRQYHHYLTECQKFKAAADTGLIMQTTLEQPPAITPIPRHRWLMKVYQLDVLQRLEYIKASITSQFGTVLKMDSTKKITKKLGGRCAKTAMWATNIGNEHGQILMSVLTTGEGVGLQPMIEGLIRRYLDANVDPPGLLYVDRDCCGGSAVSKYFLDWPFLLVRLDIWHFMRRLSIACTTDAHQLYGVFMRQLSHCIFRWEEEDVALLKRAKRSQMSKQHILNPSDADVMHAITSKELSLHCRRVTRGVEETTRLISHLIESMDGDKGLDILGVPLLDSVKMRDIWTQQSRHVGCIQDPEGVQLYTKVGTLKKGGIELPIYRCARGSTSLESFHLHMARFIPGTLANEINFQVYLLDGVYRWNEDRKRDAISEKDSHVPVCYDGPLQQAVKKLASEVLGKDMCTQYTPPKKYTGELLGLEYLFSQSTGGQMNYVDAAEALEEGTGVGVDMEGEEDDDDDEGFMEPPDITVPLLHVESHPFTEITPPPAAILEIPSDKHYRELAPGHEQLHHPVSDPALPVEPITDDSDIGPDNIPGYTQVLELATFIANLRERHTPLTTDEAKKIIELWNSLSEYDKARTKFPQRFASSPGCGRFKSPKKKVALGVTSIERAILGPNSTRANWPDCNRYVEAIVQKLVEAYPSDRRNKSTNTFLSRWTLIRDSYSRIQGLVLGNQRVMANTEIQLPSLNVKTIQQWYNKKGKDRDLKILLQGIQLPDAPMTGTGAPEPKPQQTSLPVGEGESFSFPDAPDTGGMAKLKVRHREAATIAPIQPWLPPNPVVISRRPIIMPQLPVPQAMPTSTDPVVEVPKRKYRRTAAPVRCPKCGEERSTPLHQQYMGYRYCGKTEAVPFSQWRKHLQDQGVARKHRKL